MGAEILCLVAKLGPIAKAPLSKKGSVGRPELGVDVEAFLELLQQASRGLGEIVRSIDEMVSQAIVWIRKIDSDRIPEKVQIEINLEAIRKLLNYTANYDTILDGLRSLNMTPSTEHSTLESNRDNDDQELLQALRSEVLGAIPEEVWAEAVKGFGDPDLANA